MSEQNIPIEEGWEKIVFFIVGSMNGALNSCKLDESSYYALRYIQDHGQPLSVGLGVPVSLLHRALLENRMVETKGGVSSLLAKLGKRRLVARVSVTRQELKHHFPETKGWAWVAVLSEDGNQLLEQVKFQFSQVFQQLKEGS